jgi:hypothetical protein
MRFFVKGLNPFKIQTSFKLVLFQEIIIQNIEGFGGTIPGASHISIWEPRRQLGSLIQTLRADISSRVPLAI